MNSIDYPKVNPLKESVRNLLAMVAMMLLLQCSTQTKEATNTESSTTEADTSLAILEPELLSTLAEWKKRNKELDSLYALVDSGMLTDISDDLMRAIDEHMSGGWSDSNYPDTITASSYLKTPEGLSYHPGNTYDFKVETAWAEGKDGPGIGESLSFHYSNFRQEEPITSLTIYNGHQRDSECYQQHARVKQLKLIVNGTPFAILILKDKMQGQKFNVQIASKADGPMLLTLEIMDAYAGTQFQNAAITQVMFDGTWLGI